LRLGGKPGPCWRQAGLAPSEEAKQGLADQ